MVGFKSVTNKTSSFPGLDPNIWFPTLFITQHCTVEYTWAFSTSFGANLLSQSRAIEALLPQLARFKMNYLLLFYIVANLIVTAVGGTVPRNPSVRSDLLQPSQDPFYAVPDGLDAIKPGIILKHRAPPSPIAAFSVAALNLKASHQILYRTTDSLGAATATVLTVLMPHNADTSKILSYQIAEDAASINCAPSYALQLKSATGPLLGTLVTQAELLLVEAALQQGWVVIIPDFQGSKGAYLANKLAGYATLDGIRAALNSASFTGIMANSSNLKIGMWGYSGGSLATNWAAELQPTYAPELRIAGAAVGGTIPNITTALTTINGGPFTGFIPAGILGLAAQYPEIQQVLDQHLKPQFVDKFHGVLNQCLVADAADFLFQDVIGMLDDRNLVQTNPIAVRVLGENALGRATPKIPFFWYKSVLDEVSPVEDTDALVKKYCAQGVTIEYQRDLASEHGSCAVVGAPKALSWLKNVMNGKSPQPGCSTKTVLTSLIDPATVQVVPGYIVKLLLDLLGKPVGPLLFG